MKARVLAAALTALATGGAFAADLAPVYKAAPARAAAAFDWTGFYVGGNIGAYGAVRRSITRRAHFSQRSIRSAPMARRG